MTAKTTQIIEVTMSVPQPKKHSVRYDSGDDTYVQSIYVSKTALLDKFGKIPDQLKLTVEEA